MDSRASRSVGTRVSRSLKAAPVLAGLMWTVALLYHVQGAVNHDSAWFLYGTGEWLDGARLYVDLVETNPPMVFYLHLPPVLLSRIAGLGLMPAFAIANLLLVLLSFLLCVHITGPARAERPWFWGTLLAGALATSLVVPMESFGQREHLVVLLSLGYLFASAVRASGHSVGASAAAAAGLLAGFGLALKPYYLLVPLLLELREVIRHRRLSAALRADTVAIAAVLLTYGVSVPILHPEYLRDIVPMASAAYSQGFGIPFGSFLVHRFTLILLGALVLYALARPAMTERNATDTFWLAAVGFFGAYLWQMKGFSYHLGPVLALTFVALLPLAADGPLVGDRGLSRPPQRLLAFLGTIIIATLVVSGGRYPSSRATPMYRVVEREAPRTIATLGELAFPLVVEADVRWGSRFFLIWPVPGAWRGLYGPGADPSPQRERELNDILNWTRRAVAEDLQRFKPELVFIDERPLKKQFDPMEFDWLGWATRDSVFVDEWRAYRLTERLDHLAVYARESTNGQ